jgi:hypothetical protein
MKILFTLAVLSFSLSAFAGGHGDGSHGKGRTKIDFKFSTESTTDSRLHAKIDVSAGTALLENSGSHSHNDDLAGYTINVTIGSATFSATADDKGKTRADSAATPPVPFTAKLTANGKILQLMAEGLSLKDLLGIDTTQASGQVTVEIDVSASKTDATTNVVTTIPLSTQSVTFYYSVHGTSVKGKNF